MKQMVCAIFLFITIDIHAEPQLSCIYPSADTYELEPSDNCGTIQEDGSVNISQETLDNIRWSKFGLECIYVSKPAERQSWHYITQQGKAISTPFTHDNDCTHFSEGLVAGRANNQIAFYNQALTIVQKTDYSYASRFFQGYAKVCRGELNIQYLGDDKEHYTYQGGICGFIDKNFKVVIPIQYPYESTPEPKIP